MARILAAIIFTIAGLISFSAGALGLGEIDLKSALNQPFSAEIPIASEAPGDIEGLHVEIASVETFQQFGLDRAAFLADFQFSIITGESDTAGSAVQITSQKPVVEPFVTLLLEVSWAQGRLLREYTVLLDPPVFAAESVAPVVAAPSSGSQRSNLTQRETATPAKTSAPTASVSAPAGAVPAPARSEPMVQPDTSDQVEVDGDGGMYGPVKRNDTLWGIAGEFAESTSVSRNQMMLAIYQANPEAFTGNINRLKAGMILRVPSAQEVALGGSEATSEVRRQNQQWRAAARRDEPQSGRLQLVPPPEIDSAAVSESGTESATRTGVDEDQPTVSGAAQDKLQGRVTELEDQLADSQRQLQIRDQELAALQRQLGASEVDETPVAEIPVAEVPVAEVDSQLEVDPFIDELEADALAPDVESMAPPTEPVAETESPAVVDVTPAPVAQDEESFIGALFMNPLVYISLAIVLLLAWLFARKRSKSEESIETGQWNEFEAADDEGFDVEAHEATARLRAEPQPQDATFVVEESTPADETDDGSSISLTDIASEDWDGLAEDSETPLERTISTDSVVNLDQVDPIAESDFHMAYGLYDQAADLLTRSVEKDPERKDLRMKLLEVYFIWENQDGFMKEATALQARIDDTADPDWNKVLIMGKQICPDAALFSGDVGPVPSSEGVDLEFGDEGGADDVIDFAFDDAAADLDLDLTGDGSDDDSSNQDQTGALDLEFAIGDEEIGDEDEVTQVVGDDYPELSGDTPTMETPTIESPAMDMDNDSASTMETPTIESPAIDLDLDMDSASTMETPTIESKIGQWTDDEPDSVSDQTAEIDLDDLDLDLSGLSDMLDDDSAEDESDDDSLPLGLSGDDDVDSTAEMRHLDGSGETAEQPKIGGGDTAEQPLFGGGDDNSSGQPGFMEEAEEADAVLDIGDPVALDEDPTAEVEGSGGNVIDGATMTEVGTKLDLARAYIDMGDLDGASSILKEVLEEAGEEQRQEAQQLLDDLQG